MTYFSRSINPQTTLLFFSIVLITCSFIVTEGFTQNSGKIQGEVLNGQTSEPLPNANVFLVGTTLGAASDLNGRFVIQNVPAGDYQIKVTFMGYEPVISDIVVAAGQALELKFELREDFFQTQQVVVTATRAPRLMEDVPVVTELITRQEIEEKGAEDLSEILEDRPGITIESGTTGGKFLYMNGVDSRRILFLVDNVPVSGKLNNRIQLNYIDSDKIDHIEIVKGPGSALYGNDAMGGVINIITKGYSENLKIEATGRAGSQDLYSGNLNISGRSNRFGYSLSFDHATEGAEKVASEIEIKEIASSNANAKLEYSDRSVGNLELRAEYKQDKQISESFFMGGLSDNESKVNNVTTSLVWNKNFSDQFGVDITGFWADNFRTYETLVQGSPMPSSIDTTTDKMIGMKSDFTYRPYDKIMIDVGFDLSSNDYENERLTEVQTRNQTGIFTQLETNPFSQLTLIVGGRYDKITDLKGHFSPRFSAMYNFDSGLKLRGSWGGGFRAPSFIELYSDFPIPIPGMPLRIVGNPDLKPERSIGGNFGIEYLWNSFLQFNATVFQNEFKDMIVDYEPQMFTYSYLNVESATFRGIELQSQFYLRNNLTSTLSYNFTDIAQKDEDVAFSKISPHTASLRVVYGLFKNKVKFSLREQLFSARDILVVSGHSGSFSKQKKDAYHVLDLTLSYKLNNALSIRFGATNLNDYTDEEYGPYVGRRFFAGISSTFQRK